MQKSSEEKPKANMSGGHVFSAYVSAGGLKPTPLVDKIVSAALTCVINGYRPDINFLHFFIDFYTPRSHIDYFKDVSKFMVTCITQKA